MQAQGARSGRNINDKTQRDLNKVGAYRSIAEVKEVKKTW